MHVYRLMAAQYSVGQLCCMQSTHMFAVDMPPTIYGGKELQRCGTLSNKEAELVTNMWGELLCMIRMRRSARSAVQLAVTTLATP